MKKTAGGIHHNLPIIMIYWWSESTCTTVECSGNCLMDCSDILPTVACYSAPVTYTYQHKHWVCVYIIKDIYSIQMRSVTETIMFTQHKFNKQKYPFSAWIQHLNSKYVYKQKWDWATVVFKHCSRYELFWLFFQQFPGDESFSGNCNIRHLHLQWNLYK